MVTIVEFLITTKHLEKLDPALFRQGKAVTCNKTTISQFLK